MGESHRLSTELRKGTGEFLMIDCVLEIAGRIKALGEKKREQRKIKKLRAMGMHIGEHIWMPLSTWIDFSHCFLISIGDRCRFAPNCVILAHDACMNEFLDAGRVGRVTIHESCSFGYGAIIMPGVEIGPRAIVGAFSVVTDNVPPDSVVSGNPAKVVASLEHFLKYHRLSMRRSPQFQYSEYGSDYLPEIKRKEMLSKLDKTCGYMVGGYTSMFEGKSEVKSPRK